MRIDERLHKFSAMRSALMDRLHAMTPAQLTARPQPDKWSILEITEHLVLAERAVLHGLPQFSSLTERERSLRHKALYALVVFILKARFPVRVPSRAMVPTGERSLSELSHLWDESQAWFHAYIAQLDARGLRRAVFRHPVAGPLTVAQAIYLARVHLEVHLRQIDRLCRPIS